MASYQELAQLYSTKVLKERLAVAIAIAAQSILGEDAGTANHNARYAWAARAMANPNGEADRFLIGVLAANALATAAQIEAATDNQIQNNVNTMVDLFALADANAGVV